MHLNELIDRALADGSIPITIRSVNIEGPILRIGSFKDDRGVIFVDNTMINGTYNNNRIFNVDADQMNYDCRFDFDPSDLKEKGVVVTILRNQISLREVRLSDHSASGSINWQAVTITPEDVDAGIRKMKSTLRLKVLEYFKENKAKLIQQLDKLLPSIVTFIK
jgi:hypothetical protein